MLFIVFLTTNKIGESLYNIFIRNFAAHICVCKARLYASTNEKNSLLINDMLGFVANDE